jgi:hypothetical protein
MSILAFRSSFEIATLPPRVSFAEAFELYSDVCSFAGIAVVAK